MKKHQSTPLVAATAARLSRSIKTGTWELLPGCSLLARRFAVSRPTMNKVLLLLEKRGVVQKNKNGTYSIAPSIKPKNDFQPKKKSSHHSAQRIAVTLKTSLTNGTFPPGKELPKTYYFVCTFHVSSHTVCDALKILEKKNLIRKQGKKWISGPSTEHSLHVMPSSLTPGKPTLLFITPHAQSLFFFNETPPIIHFSLAFHGEIDRFGIVSKLVLNQGNSLSEQESIHLLEETIRSLDTAYIGTFLFAKIQEMPCLQTLCSVCARYGRPVVLFDSTDEIALPPRQTGDTIYRCHLDELQACRLALKTLANLGHQRICMFCYNSKSYDWIPRRVQAVQKSIRDLSLPLSLVTVNHSEQFWDFSNWNSIERFEEEMDYFGRANTKSTKSGIIRKPSLGGELLNRTRHLIAMLVDNDITALIAPNDLIAREYLVWLELVGISVPHDISLISFDNMQSVRYFPISTIDFGYTQLGFNAAHLLIGDIQMKKGRKGNIPGVCRLIDRGSIGLPRKSRLSLPAL